jgi:hypothetical protein
MVLYSNKTPAETKTGSLMVVGSKIGVVLALQMKMKLTCPVTPVHILPGNENAMMNITSWLFGSVPE